MNAKLGNLDSSGNVFTVTEDSFIDMASDAGQLRVAESGLTFDQFKTVRAAVDMIHGWGLFRTHDNYHRKSNNFVCKAEYGTLHKYWNMLLGENLKL